MLALGIRLGPSGTLPHNGIDYWAKDAAAIQVDADAEMIGLVKNVSVGINGDAAAASKALFARLQNRALKCHDNRDDRLSQIKAVKAEWEAELDDWRHEKDPYSIDMIKEAPDRMHPRQMLRELEKAIPEDGVVSTDIGNICSIANSYLRFEKPRSMLAAMSFGNCGYAFPVAIGAKVARPDRPVIAYVGDGAWCMSFGEILTCVRENIPVTAVVFNNGQWGAEKKNQVDFYSHRFVGTNLENPGFAAIAKVMGAEGHVIDNLSDVGPALDEACKAQADGKTTVLEMMVTRELGDPFRRDALSMPVRYLDKYKDYV